MSGLGQVGIGVDEGKRRMAGLFEPEAMMQQVAHVEFGQTCLFGPE